MIDKALEAYLNEKKYKDGFLVLDDLPMEDNTRVGANGCVERVKTPCGWYYLKFDYKYARPKHDFTEEENFKVFKPDMDAEILLPLLYQKLGIECAKNTPVIVDGWRKVLSKNILQNKQIVPANKFHFEVARQIGYTINKLEYLFQDKNPAVKYFLDKALEDRLKANAISLAVCDSDRAPCNNFYEINGKGLATRMLAIDHESSGQAFKKNKSVTDLNFVNDFTPAMLTAKQLVNLLKNDKLAREHFDSIKFANELENVDVKHIAYNYSNETGYEFSKNIVDYYAENFEKTAELFQE